MVIEVCYRRDASNNPQGEFYWRKLQRNEMTDLKAQPGDLKLMD